MIFVLRCQDWSESSQVIFFLAREVGRLRGLAKGSRRGLNPFSGPLDRWVLGDAVFSMTDPNKLATLMELFETERFDGLRRHLPAFYGASYLTELITAIVPDADAQPALFDLLIQAMRTLAEVEATACRAVTYAAAWRLLDLLGYVPGWDKCVQCGQPLEPGKPVDYSAGLGGPVCPACRPEGRVHRLTGRTAQAAAFLTTADWAEVRRVRLSEPTAAQMRAILTARVAELAGKDLSAAKYV
jgi:DNA repair protein RecO (recombination protein O)